MGLYPTNGSGFASCQMRCRENIQRARDGCHKPLEVGKHYFKLSSEHEKICLVDITLYVVSSG